MARRKSRRPSPKRRSGRAASPASRNNAISGSGHSRALPREAEIAVIGAGVAGLSAALFLARAGREVAVLDAGEPWGQASGGNAGTLSIQAMRVETLALSRLGVSLWRDFDAEFGAGYGRPGGLRVAESERDVALLRQTTEEQRQAGLPLEWLEGNALRDLAPWLGQSMHAGTFCEEDAQSSPLIAGAGLVHAVRRAGASVLSGCALTAVAAEAGGFRLSTAQGGMRARKLVLAAGPWSGAFLPMLGLSLPLHVDVNMLTITEPSVPVFDRVVSHIAGILTLKQYANGTCLIGGGWQGRGAFSAGLKEVDHLRLKQNWRTAATVIPGLARLRALRSWAGYQAVTLDALPVVGPLGGGAFIAMGARGGYTMGPAIGLCAAEMVQGREAPVPLHDFRPGRFAS